MSRVTDIQDTENEERILTFMESLTPGNTELLNKMEKEALAAGIPIIRTQTQSLIKFFLELKKPEKILEVGTATGFSASLMAVYAPRAQITTIERDPEREKKAKQNTALVDDSGRITLLEGDAAEILPTLEGPYDMIFMDAAKGQYIRFYPEVKRLLAKGGILLTDNIFKDGEVLESKFAVRRRDRTIYKRMREYLETLTQDEELTTLLLQEGDGAAVSVRR